jgi:hypothetical protein
MRAILNLPLIRIKLLEHIRLVGRLVVDVVPLVSRVGLDDVVAADAVGVDDVIGEEIGAGAGGRGEEAEGDVFDVGDVDWALLVGEMGSKKRGRWWNRERGTLGSGVG